MRYCLIFMLFLVSCSNPKMNWYEGSGCSDLDLIPLIKPYTLYSTDESDWFVTFINDGKLDGCGLNFDNSMHVTHINVKQDAIYGYCDEENNYFVVIPSKKIEKKFDKRNEWLGYLKEIQLDTATLYNPTELFKLYNTQNIKTHSAEYLPYKALPWYSAIKETINKTEKPNSSKNTK